jgi:NTP pyrophosphatase (non-canonical NTP hydrolase)
MLEINTHDPDFEIPFFDDYQAEAVALAIYPREVWDSYLPLQLASEAGEVAGKFGKAFRKDKEVDYEAVAYELGDLLWYVANLASELGYTMSEIATMNINKLKDRKDRGVLKGDGDNR